MKKVLFVFAIAATFAACNNATETPAAANADSAAKAATADSLAKVALLEKEAISKN